MRASRRHVRSTSASARRGDSRQRPRRANGGFCMTSAAHCSSATGGGAGPAQSMPVDSRDGRRRCLRICRTRGLRVRRLDLGIPFRDHCIIRVRLEMLGRREAVGAGNGECDQLLEPCNLKVGCVNQLVPADVVLDDGRLGRIRVGEGERSETAPQLRNGCRGCTIAIRAQLAAELQRQ